MSNNDLVTVNNLTFSRGNRTIFDGIDLHVPEGKVTAIMGPSGIGKTTLLRLIGGQLYPETKERFGLMVTTFRLFLAKNSTTLVRK